ncbi:MAG: NAD-dependent epimerase/dehydratase family protein [Candidatus Thorarchaeota archaeon]
MRVLLTGAFGNVGESTLLSLLSKGYDIRCFDIDSKRNKEKASDLKSHGDFEVVWGSITEMEQLQPALINVDVIIHLAAIIPPLSETRPDFARNVNVGGMKNLLSGVSLFDKPPKLIFASSISTHGPRSPDMPVLTPNMPQKPTDNYTHHKVECETMLRESSIPWTILRLTAIPPLEISTDIDPMLFEMPLKQKIEFCHTRDVGLAFANSVEADTIGKILLIGGGQRCQLLYSDFVGRLLDAIGIGMLPENAFKNPNGSDGWFYTSWMDTRESEDLLSYQTRTFDEYIANMKDNIGALRHIVRLFSPLIRRMLLRQSPYS